MLKGYIGMYRGLQGFVFRIRASQTRGTFLSEVPRLGIIVYQGPYWDPPILGSYHMFDCEDSASSKPFHTHFFTGSGSKLVDGDLVHGTLQSIWGITYEL